VCVRKGRKKIGERDRSPTGWGAWKAELFGVYAWGKKKKKREGAEKPHGSPALTGRQGPKTGGKKRKLNKGKRAPDV